MRNLLLLLALTTCALPAHASFNGQVVLAEYLFPDAATVASGGFTPTQATVGAGVEFNSFDITAVDLSATNLLWTNIADETAFFASSVAFNGHQFSDVNNTIPPITGVTINAATDLPGFDASRISFDENSIQVNFDALVWEMSEIVSLDVTFAAVPLPDPQSIPTLSAVGLGLLGLMLGLIGYFAPRSRSQS